MQSANFHATGLWRHFTLSDGLPDLKIECLREDRQGRLWIGTHDRGVCCYDGQQFSGYTRQDGLTGNSVYSILEDEEGEVWFGTDQGLTRYDGHAFQKIEEGCSYTFLWGSCKDAQGHLWFGLGRRRGQPPAVGRWDGRTFTLLPLRDEAMPHGQSIHQVSVDVRQRVWCSGDGVYCYDPQQDQIQAIEPCPDQICNQLIRADGRIWLIGRQGLYVIDEQQLRQHASAPVRHYEALVEDDVSANLWMTTLDGEVLYGDGTTFQLVRHLNTRLWRGLCLDSRGRLWIGSYGAGLYCYDNRRMRIFTPTTGPPVTRIRCLARGRGQDFWIGTANGLVLYDDTQAAFRSIAPFVGKEITALYLNGQQQLFVGTENEGLYLYDGHQARLVDDHAEPDQCWSVGAICADADGGIWFGYGYGQGLGYYHRGRLQTFRAGDPLRYPTWISALALDAPGRVWLGSRSQEDWQGLYLFDGKDATPMFPAILDSAIRCLLKDRQGRLWIGTNEGLHCLEGDRLTGYTRDDGLPCELITALLQTRDGRLWIGTEGGGVSLFDGTIFQCLHIPGDPTANVVHALLQQDDGCCWWGTEAGLVQYTPHTIPPRIMVTSIRADQTYAHPDEVAFPASVQRLNIQFRGASPADFPDNLVYRYRLEGRDAAWQRTTATEVEYPSLHPGTYRFTVQAVDSELNYSPQARVALTVTTDPHAQALHEALRGGLATGRVIGNSPAWQAVEAQMHQVAQTETNVLITGETGTGKGLVAQTVHELSRRRDQPLVYVDCAGLDHALLNSTLFGHERGAFTGAQERRLGKFELAQGGSIFLDEIGDLPPESQAHLLRVVQERCIERVGGSQPLPIDVRLIVATHQDLAQAVQHGTFRADLYYRLLVQMIVVPPLRERREDIALLARHFVREAAAHLHQPPPRLSPAALAQLQAYSWPGNIRELKHTLLRAVALVHNGAIEPEHLLEGPGRSTAVAGNIVPLDDYLRPYLLQVLEYTDGVIYGDHGAAALLGLHPNTLRYRLAKLGIPFRKQERQRGGD